MENEMHRVIVCLATASILTGFASAQTINVPEGDWVWNAELNVNGLTLANSGSTCLTRETSELDLSEIVGKFERYLQYLGLERRRRHYLFRA